MVRLFGVRFAVELGLDREEQEEEEQGDVESLTLPLAFFEDAVGLDFGFKGE